MYGTISRVKGGQALRTDEISGQCGEPIVGESFVLMGTALDPAMDRRMVTTSPVARAYQRDDVPWNEWVFETESGSTYRLVEAMRR